jgi:hypothetical protein
VRGSQDPIPGSETQGTSRDDARSDRRPIWALPVLILGLLIALWIVSLLVDFVASAWADPGGRDVSTMMLGYFLPVLVPLSAILIVAGGLAVIRPWTAKRPWLRLVWVGGVLMLAVSACTIPWLITDPPTTSVAVPDRSMGFRASKDCGTGGWIARGRSPPASTWLRGSVLGTPTWERTTKSTRASPAITLRSSSGLTGSAPRQRRKS